MGVCWSTPPLIDAPVTTDERLLLEADDGAPRYEQREGTRLAKCVDVYDGDTFTVLIVVEGVVFRRRCRCIGYDSPEMRGKDADKPRALAARDELERVIPEGAFLLHFKGTDKYGRLLVRFKVGGEWLADYMIRTGHGYSYSGGTKQQ